MIQILTAPLAAMTQGLGKQLTKFEARATIYVYFHILNLIVLSAELKRRERQLSPFFVQYICIYHKYLLYLHYIKTFVYGEGFFKGSC